MIKLEFTFPKLAEKFQKHSRQLHLLLAATMQTNRSMMFDKDGADNGKPKWKDLSWRNGRPLQKTGALRKSMGPINDGIKPGVATGSILTISGRTVTIGSSLMVARMMNDGTTKMPGGVMRPHSAQALKIPLPESAQGVTVRERQQGFMFRKWVKIPARPMDEITDQDRSEWAETMANYIAELLNESA